MEFAWRIALLAFFLAGCSGLRPSGTSAPDCAREPSLARGASDGKSGRRADLSFLRSCSAASRSLALAAYREGFEATRPRPKAAAGAAVVEDEVEVEAASVLAEPMAVTNPEQGREPQGTMSWVCEVEAGSKVFTGVGITRDEALGSARATCGSHFQSSYCSKSDCKQNL